MSDQTPAAPPKRPSGTLARWLGGSDYQASETSRATKEMERARLLDACSVEPPPPPETRP